MAAVNITEYDIPSTPLLARPGNGRGNIDPKLVFAVMGQLKTDFPNGLCLEEVQKCQGFERFRVVLETYLSTISHKKGVPLVCRPGDSRIAADPPEHGELEVPYKFCPFHNRMLYQVLSSMCKSGHGEKTIREYRNNSDGRAAFLACMLYCEPEGQKSYSSADALVMISGTKIKGLVHPLDSFTQMSTARETYDRSSPMPLDETVFIGLVVAVLKENGNYAQVLKDFRQGLFNTNSSSELMRQATMHYVSTLKEQEERGVAAAAAAALNATQQNNPATGLSSPGAPRLPISAHHARRAAGPGKWEHLCQFCPKDGIFHSIKNCPTLKPMVKRLPKRFDPRTAAATIAAGTAGAAAAVTATSRNDLPNNAEEFYGGAGFLVRGVSPATNNLASGDSAPRGSFNITSGHMCMVLSCLLLLVAGFALVGIALYVLASGVTVSHGHSLVSANVSAVTFRVDSGCTEHVVASRDLIHIWDDALPAMYFDTAGGRRKASGGGSSTFLAQMQDGNLQEITLSPIYLLESQDFNLLSVGWMVEGENWQSPDFKALNWPDNSGRVFQFSRVRKEYIMELIPANTPGTALPLATGAEFEDGTTASVQDGAETSRPRGSKSARRRRQATFANVSAVDPDVTMDYHNSVEAARKFNVPIGSVATRRAQRTVEQRDTTDWQMKRTEVSKHAIARFPANKVTTDVFTDGLGPVLGNSHAEKFYSESDSGFGHLWAKGSFLLNPPFFNDVILRTLQKVLKDFAESPSDSHYLLIVPDMPGATWYGLLSYFEILEIYPQGTMLFSCPAKGAYDKEKLVPAGDEGGPDRFFIRETHFPVVVAYKGPLTPSPINPYTLAHARFAHMNTRDMAKMVRKGVDFGLQLDANMVASHLPPHACGICNLSKTTQPTFSSADQTYLNEAAPFGIVVADIAGPISPPSPNGMRSVVAFTALPVKWRFSVAMTRKVDVLEAFVRFCAFVRSLGHEVKGMVLQTDAEEVLIDGAFAAHCESVGVVLRHSPPGLKEMNGFAENAFRHLWPMVRALLNNMQVDLKYWPYAVHHVTWLRNRLPNASIGFKSPFELVYGYAPDLTCVRVFWSPVFAWIDPKTRDKLTNTSLSGVYVGHSEVSNAYLVLDPATDRVYERGRANIVEDSALLGRLMGSIGLTDMTEVSFVNHYTSCPAPFLKHLPSEAAGKQLPLKILAHHAWYDADNHECVAILRLSCAKYPKGFWCPAGTYLLHADNKQRNWTTLARYLAYRVSAGFVNEIYPLFTVVRSALPGFEHDMECLVVSVDTSRVDSKDTMYGLVHSPEHQMEYCDAKSVHVTFPSDGVPDSISLVVASYPSYKVTSEKITFTNVSLPMVAGVAMAAKPINMKAGEMVPTHYQQAMTLPAAPKWLGAVDEEIRSMHLKKVFKLTAEKLPPGVKAIGTRFVFDIKLHLDMTIERYKARLVCKGFMQVAGVHFDPDDLHSPTACDLSLMCVFSFVVTYDLQFKHVDVKTAFLNSVLDEDIWIKFPVGYVHPEGHQYAQLGKAVYGLKQATKKWYDTQHVQMLAFDSQISRSKSDPGFYYLVTAGGKRVSSLDSAVSCSPDFWFLVNLHVDDYAVAYSHEEYYARWVLHMSSHFAITELGDVSKLLGMRVQRTPTTLVIDHFMYIGMLGHTYGVCPDTAVSTPMRHGLKLTHLPGGPDPNFPFRELNGSMMYAVRKTHPEALWPVVFLSQFSITYGKEAMDAAYQVLGYLMTVRHRPLTFRKPEKDGNVFPPRVVVYSDADFAENVVDRKSYSGSATYMDGNLVAWNSSKQRYIAASSNESEYVAVSEACKDGLQIVHFLSEVVQVELPATIMIDNKGAEFMAQNDVTNKRSKHIDLRYHMIRDYVKQGFFQLTHVSTAYNTADIMTKALERVKHELHTNSLLRDMTTVAVGTVVSRMT